ncbi:hypothetical protein ACFLXX_05835, partial [Chloroflexota bacterium]
SSPQLGQQSLTDEYRVPGLVLVISYTISYHPQKPLVPANAIDLIVKYTQKIGYLWGCFLRKIA